MRGIIFAVFFMAIGGVATFLTLDYFGSPPLRGSADRDSLARTKTDPRSIEEDVFALCVDYGSTADEVSFRKEDGAIEESQARLVRFKLLNVSPIRVDVLRIEAWFEEEWIRLRDERIYLDPDERSDWIMYLAIPEIEYSDAVVKRRVNGDKLRISYLWGMDAKSVVQPFAHSSRCDRPDF